MIARVFPDRPSKWEADQLRLWALEHVIGCIGPCSVDALIRAAERVERYLGGIDQPSDGDVQASDERATIASPRAASASPMMAKAAEFDNDDADAASTSARDGLAGSSIVIPAVTELRRRAAKDAEYWRKCGLDHQRSAADYARFADALDRAASLPGPWTIDLADAVIREVSDFAALGLGQRTTAMRAAAIEAAFGDGAGDAR